MSTAGNYTVTLSVPSGYSATTPTSYSNLSCTRNLDFGIKQNSVTVQGHFVDQNGAYLTTNIGQGVTINALAPTYQDLGTFWSNTLSPGTYTVTASNSNPAYTLSYSSCINCVNHPLPYTSGNSVTVSLPVSGNYADIYFKYTPAYSISGVVFIDNNPQNGVKDPAESLYPNATLNLSGPSTGTTVSNNTTGYSFPALLPGNNYIVTLTVPNNYDPTTTNPRSVNITNANITGIDFGIKPVASVKWFQGKGGDMRLDTGFIDPIPLVGTYVSQVNSNGTPGVVFSGDSAFDKGSGSWSASGWIAGGTAYPELFPSSKIKTSYQNMYNLIVKNLAKNSQTTIVLSTVAGCSNYSSCTLPANLSPGVYEAGSSVNLINASYTFPANGNYVFLINGDLTINGNLTLSSGSTLAFFVSGNIKVIGTVGNVYNAAFNSPSPNLEGIFATDKSFIVQDDGAICPTKDKRLDIKGSVIVNSIPLNGGDFSFSNRDFCVNTYPIVYIEENPFFILNMPDYLNLPSQTWQEVAP